MEVGLRGLSQHLIHIKSPGEVTNCRGLMLLGAVDKRGAFAVGILDVILEMSLLLGCDLHS